MYNFDELVERRNTACAKWDERQDVLPLWVADMDFEVAPEISRAIRKRAEHAVYGYVKTSDEYYNSIINWVKRRHGIDIKKEWIVFSGGIVPGINVMINALTEPNDKVIVQTPVYYPFYSAITNNECSILKNPLKLKNGKYEMDFDDLKEKLKDEKVKVMILCSPHNPTGRVWTEKELKAVGELCRENNVVVISDEIHSDLVYKPNKHTPFLAVDDEFKNNSIMCISPSKTFNLAGLQVSSLIIPDKDIRKKVIKAMERSTAVWPNVFGMEASIAAYNESEAWLEELMDYLKSNLKFMEEYINLNIPEVELIRPEGTYLVWLDFRKLNMSVKQLKSFMLNKAKVWLDEGYIFGEEGNGFERVNIACSRSTLKEALDRISNALKSR
ncbi:MalY/PatB family protein [Clostridium felsineum]|uniref:cysteine-S-conjugate beta-lyase n=1 Tax=Clostridium felsineum TaxID=36839 RepID=A0A1S8LED9_9CLOT|nr:MalY/PatB family protein [Clostridium felsineum]MCR3760945.1 pyridoxal phosphate-dependent aminotransferase [Clostridium felsineum]URZ05229.1 Cystathionine beta-lyase PatB [Clostridium felsineum]URZ10270.1 Cystathionine beta-lyase PatB [Clostridium felsineum]